MIKGFDISEGLIRILDAADQVVGTGLLLDETGLILTASHVVLSWDDQREGRSLPPSSAFRFEGEIVHWMRNGQGDRPAPTHSATVLPDYWRDFESGDICLLRYPGDIPSGVRPYGLAESRDQDVPGSELLAYGYPARVGGMRQVSATLAGQVTECEKFLAYQLNAPHLEPGFSGGPVLSMDTGSIIGLVSWIEPDENGVPKRSFLIPVAEIVKVKADLPRKKIFTQRERYRWTQAGESLEIVEEYLARIVENRRKKKEELDDKYLTISGAIESEIHARPHRLDTGDGASTLVAEDTELTQSAVEVTRLYEQYPRLHLAGMPGSGKTTSLEKIWYDHCARIGGPPFSEPVPILISAIRYGGRRSFRELIKEELRLYPGDEPKLEALLEKGGIRILVDGLNEVRLRDLSEAKTELYDLIKEYPHLPVVITSRLHGLGDYLIEEGVTLGIKHFLIQPLGMEDIRDYLLNTCDSETEAVRIWKLINQSTDTRELANNPMYLRMLVDIISGADREFDRVPETKGGLYRLFMNRLVRDMVKRQLTKIESLDIDDLNRALARMGFEVVRKISLSKQVMRGICREYLGDADADLIIRAFIHNKLIVRQTDRNSYVFKHPSYGEYFAAQHLQNHLIDEGAFPKGFAPYLQYWYESVLMCAVLFDNEDHLQLLYDRLWADRRRFAGEARIRVADYRKKGDPERPGCLRLARWPVLSAGSFPRLDTITRFVVICQQNRDRGAVAANTAPASFIGDRLYRDTLARIKPRARFWCKIAIHYDYELFPTEELFAAIGSLGDPLLLLEMFQHPAFVAVWSGSYYWRNQWLCHFGREKAYAIIAERDNLLARLKEDLGTTDREVWLEKLSVIQEELNRKDWEVNRREELFNALSSPPDWRELDLRADRAVTSFVENLKDPVGTYQLIMEVVYAPSRFQFLDEKSDRGPGPIFSRDLESLKTRILEYIVRHELADLQELFKLYGDLDVLQLINRDKPEQYREQVAQLPQIVAKLADTPNFCYHSMFVRAKEDRGKAEKIYHRKLEALEKAEKSYAKSKGKNSAAAKRYAAAEWECKKAERGVYPVHIYLVRRLFLSNRYISPFAQPEIDNIRFLTKEDLDIIHQHRYRPSSDILRSIEELDEKEGVDIEAYERIQAQHPGEPYTFVRLIKALKRRRDFDRIYELLHATDLKIDMVNAAFIYYHRAQASAELGLPEENIDNLNELIDNTDSFYYISRVRKYLQEKLDEGFGDNPTLLFALARARFKYNQFDAAIELLGRIDQDSEHQPLALRTIGDCYKQSERHEEALTIYRQTLQWIERRGRENYRDNFYVITKKVFKSLQYLGREGEAVAVLESLVDEFKWPKLYIQCASLRANRQEYDRAANLLEEGLAHTQEPIRFLARLVKYYRKSQDFDRETHALERWLQLLPKNERYSLAKLMQKFGEAKLYNRVIDIGGKITAPEKFPILGLLELANAYKKMGRILPAIETYKIVLARQVDQSVTLASIGQCYVRLERYELALQYHRRALKANPDNQASAQHIKRIQARMHETEPQLARVPATGRFFRFDFRPQLAPDRISSISHKLQLMSELSFNTAIIYDMTSLMNCFQQDHAGAFSIREIYQEIQKIPELERVTVQLAYANWGDARLRRVNSEVAQLGIEAVQITTSNPTFIKNQFLLNLGMDVTELMHSRPEIDYYVFISNDHNLLTLLKRLRKHGKSFLNCFYNDFANPMLRSSADQFLGLEAPDEAIGNVEQSSNGSAATTSSGSKQPLPFYRRYYPIPPIKTMTRDQKIVKVRELLGKLAADESMTKSIRKEGLSFGELQQAITYLLGEWGKIEFGCAKFIDLVRILVFETPMQIFRLNREDRMPILGLRDNPPPDTFPEPDDEEFEIHSAQAYRNLLSHETPKIILPPKLVIQRIAPQIMAMGENRGTISECSELISEKLEHEVEEKDIRTLLYTFRNINILESAGTGTDPDLQYWIGEAYLVDDQAWRSRLREVAKEKIVSIINEPASEDILNILY